MKKIIYLLCLSFLICNPAFSAVDIPWINTIPYKPYTEEIKLDKTLTDIYNKNGIKIEKNVYKFEYVYKLGIPYEYIISNNTGEDLFLKGVDSDYHTNKNITRKSHWCRMIPRSMKTWQIWVPIYGVYYGFFKMDLEKNSYIRDFPKNYTLKSGESLRILAMGLKLDEIQKLKFIFTNNNNDFSIEF